MKYITKPSAIPIHKNDDRQREFAVMSKGLGECYLTRNMIQWHHYAMTSRSYVTIDGKQIAMPRYYRDRLYSKDEKKALAYIVSEERKAKEFYEEFMNVSQQKNYSQLQTDLSNHKKLNHGKATMVETSLQRKGISQALRAKSFTVSNGTRSNNVFTNITRKVHARAPLA
jgi:hypothetical protein